jgi:hypothetical protein
VAEATLGSLDQYRAALTKVDMAPNQIGEHLEQVRLVYVWAEGRELVARNRIALYRFKLAKEERRTGAVVLYRSNGAARGYVRRHGRGTAN